MLDQKTREILEFGFHNELHSDPYCLDIEIHALEGRKTADIILTSWELYDEKKFETLYRNLIKKFDEEYGFKQEEITIKTTSYYDFKIVYRVKLEKLIELAGLFKVKGIGNGLVY